MSISNSILWQAIVGYASLQSLIFFLVLMIKKSGEVKANRLLSALTFCFFLILLNEFISESLGYENAPHLLFLTGPIWYLIPPIIYLYINFFVADIRSKYLDLVHLLPFIFVLQSNLEFYSYSAEIKLQYYQRFIQEGEIHRTHNLNYILFLIQTFIYSSLSLRSIFSASKLQSMLNYKNLPWLKVLCYGLIMLSGIGLIMVVAVNWGYSLITINSDFFTVWITIIITVLFFKTQMTPKQLYWRKPSVEENPQLETAMSSIQHFMEDHIPYRDPKFSINHLSVEMGMSKHRIQQAVKKFYGCTFNTYINELRIHDVKKRLKEPENEIYTIESIAQDSGFASAATFYRWFRKSEGTTPGTLLDKE